MFLITIGLALIGLSFVATIAFAVTLGRTNFPRIAAWYLENWVAVALFTAFFFLVSALILLSLAPAEWIGDYSKAGVSVLDQIFVLIGFAYDAIIIPGLFLSGRWERSRAPYRIN